MLFFPLKVTQFTLKLNPYPVLIENAIQEILSMADISHKKAIVQHPSGQISSLILMGGIS